MSGMQINYTELCRLSVVQSFYQNSICRNYTTEPQLDLLIQPTDSCLITLKNMDLVFRNTDTNGGFVILARVSRKNAIGNDVLRFAPKPADSLSFLMILKNPDLVNFSELPAQISSDRLYYFSNKVTDNTAARNDLHLSQQSAGVDGSVDNIKFSSGNYRFHNGAVVLPGTARLVNELTGDIIYPVSIVNQGGQADLNFNLQIYPTGRYKLQINGTPVDEIYYTGNISGNRVFGIISLSLDQTPISNYRIVEPDYSMLPERPFYKIHFLNRMVFWRYTIRLQNNSPVYLEMAGLTPAEKTDFLNRLNILSNDVGVVFTKTASSDFEFEFISTAKIGLHEKYFSASDPNHPLLNLILTKYIGLVNNAPVKSNLPFPVYSLIDASVPNKIYTDIFLTI